MLTSKCKRKLQVMAMSRADVDGGKNARGPEQTNLNLSKISKESQVRGHNVTSSRVADMDGERRRSLIMCRRGRDCVTVYSERVDAARPSVGEAYFSVRAAPHVNTSNVNIYIKIKVKPMIRQRL